ncbi:MAG: hypothetical protein US20_C0002G0004 [Candidatus Pacebacteria bacterium GW2011_GWF1_36_5]|nr:MAG: hypothetical protein US20_C0002G0004 [Candidatus Pacebacteria bacterium GW2011_GWF1_36_5]
MKTAEQMMCEWMQSQLMDNQTFTINSEQYLEIYNWYQEVELAERKRNRIDMPDLYNDGRCQPLSLGMDGIELPFAKWTGNEETMRYAKRVDGNHHEIIQGLRDCGYKVKDTSKYGDGFPDCIVAGGGRVVMLEIKQGSAKLTDAEKEFHEAFYGLGLHVVRTLEQALDVMRKETI